jgi:predicted permease
MLLFDTILPVFAKTLMPVFLVATAGFLLARAFTLDSRTLGRILFYLATPSLVFRSLYQMQIDFATLQQLALVVGAVAVATGALGWLASFDQDRRRRSAITLTSAISNNGNMGIPICYFALGEAGLALGSLYYVVNAFLGNTLGVVVASSGRAPFGKALLQSLKVPMLYAAFLGLALNQASVELPVGLFRAVDLLGDAAIPGMLILLGMQLSDAPIRERQSVIYRSAAIRLLIAPLLAWLLCMAFDVSGVTRSVIILQAAMPTAVMTAVLTTEYDAAPRLVATVIFFSTLASMITLTAVLWFIL